MSLEREALTSQIIFKIDKDQPSLLIHSKLTIQVDKTRISISLLLQ